MRQKVAKKLRKMAEQSQARPTFYARSPKGTVVVGGKRLIYKELKRAWKERHR